MTSEALLCISLSTQLARFVSTRAAWRQRAGRALSSTCGFAFARLSTLRWIVAAACALCSVGAHAQLRYAGSDTLDPVIEAVSKFRCARPAPRRACASCARCALRWSAPRDRSNPTRRRPAQPLAISMSSFQLRLMRWGWLFRPRTLGSKMSRLAKPRRCLILLRLEKSCLRSRREMVFPICRFEQRESA